MLSVGNREKTGQKACDMNKEKLFKFCFGCNPSDFSEKVIITPFLPIKHFQEYLEATRTFSGRLYSGFTTKKGITVIRCGVGDRLLGDAVLLMGCAATRKAIFAGTCGGLEGCEIGDFMVAESAFNGEGFSKYYSSGFSIANEIATGEMIEADQEYAESLFGFLEERLYAGSSLHRGSVFTIGSIVAEHERNLVCIRDEGFQAIDMELSAVYQAARMIGIASVGLLVVSDKPLIKGLGEDIDGIEKKALDDGIDELVRLSVEFADA